MIIEQSVITYLRSDTQLASMVGDHIYYHRVPTDNVDSAGTKVKMPWVVVTNSGGMPERLTRGSLTYTGLTEAYDTLTIYVDDMQQLRGAQITQRVEDLLRNYRGNMLPARDTHFRAGTTRDLDGYQGNFRYLISVYVRYLFDTDFPNREEE
jgi:hypothetical protein